jgi:aldo/keto reductase family protein
MTTLDSYLTLGRSGLRVSPLSLGTMTFGEDDGWGARAETAEAILAEYLDCGGNVVDTANTYANGHSEKIIGELVVTQRRIRLPHHKVSYSLRPHRKPPSSRVCATWKRNCSSLGSVHPTPPSRSAIMPSTETLIE